MLNEKSDIRITKLNSISISLMLIINYIAAVMNINGGIIIIISIIVALQLLANNRISINLSILILIGLILVCFFISLLIIDNKTYTFDYLSKFIVFGIIPLYLASRKFDKAIVYKTILTISFLTIPLLHLLEYNSYLSENKMGLTYSLLPIFLVAIICVKEKWKIKIMAIAVIISSGKVFIDISSRGVIVAILLFIIGYFYITRFKGTIKQSIFTLLSIFATSVIAIRFWEVLLKIQQLLWAFNVRFYPLDKTISYQMQDKLLNARDVIWENALNGIYDNFFFGQGIGTFEVLYGTYSHNIFLQSFWEGGLFFFVPIIWVMVFVLSTIIKNRDEHTSIFLIFLLIISYASLLFSSTMWMNQGLWFLFGLILVKKNKRIFWRKIA